MHFDIPKSPKLPERHPVGQPSRNSTSALDVVRKESDHNWTLEEPRIPYELIVAILHLSLPPAYVDDHESPSPDPCPTYSITLYSLRSVCKWWRDVVDGTPFFWKVVCSALPTEVNSAILLKSGQRHLVIHCLLQEPPQHEFLELANRHRHRWGTAAFQIIPAAYAESVASYLAAPAPLLQSLVLSSKAQPPQPVYHLFGGQTQNIRHLNIYGSRIEWLPNAFTGLRRLILAEISQGGLTTQYLLDILASSPSLEILDLSNIEFDPPPIDVRSPPTRFPLLRFLRLGAISAMAVDCILRSLAVEPSVVTRIHLSLSLDEPNFDAARFVTETLPAFSPVLNRLNASCGGSDLRFRFRQNFIWAAGNGAGHSFSFYLPLISLSTYLPWIEQAVGVGVPGVVVRLHFGHFPSTATAVLPVLRPSRIITGMVLNTVLDSWRLDPIFDALSGLETLDGSHTTADAIPSFPALRTIRFTDWMWSLDRIDQALERRFAKRTSMGLNIPDLLVELSYPDTIFWAYGSEGMLSFDTLQRIRAIDGVKDVRVECDSTTKDGMMAVVWCEASSQVVWG
ncbi:hypothetical protein FRC04_001681 [Tulasnella sp. 424]|nr:hypothetical protein FRC04_001681 [Tulasnella sp. 424]